MAQQDSIRHTGTITSVGDGTVEVAVKPEEACGSCHAKSICGASGDNDRRMVVPVLDPSEFTTGEIVEVSVEKTMGIRAVLLAYVVPFIVMFAVLLTMLRLGYSELKSGIWSLASVAVWFLLLRMFRRRLDKEIIFKVHKIDE